MRRPARRKLRSASTLAASVGLASALIACRGGEAPRSDPPDETVACVEPEGAPDFLDPTAEAKAKADADRAWIEAHYVKREVMIPMRDGVSLFTSIYSPRPGDWGKMPEGPAPILMKRTPYSVGPYGEDAFPTSLGPSRALMKAGYIFVYQDVRGRFMSEGTFVNMTPHHDAHGGAEGEGPVDESTDTHDTVAWLVEHLDGHNGRVGQWGISYPGFYAAAGMIDHHPALVAVSPQAPIADWWFDDFHHHGAFFLPHAFNFLVRFGKPRPEPVKAWGPRFDHGTPDGYAWFLELGSLRNATERYMQDVAFWLEVVAHPNRDAYWEARDLLPHLHDVAPAVLTVGGLFDAEDLYGPLHIYQSIESKNPDVFNALVMGPWRHGGWARDDGDHLGNAYFGGKHSLHYRTEIEQVFFEHYLRGPGPGTAVDLPEASVFETGRNQWRAFDTWPPEDLDPTDFYLGPEGALGEAPPTAAKSGAGYDAWISDPDQPVPYTEEVSIGMTREYMTDDQRFASRRPDVMSYQTAPLTEALTVAGPIEVELWVSTDQRDADFVVKVIDVFPDDAPDHEYLAPGQHMGGYQMMVRSEVFRGRFREGYDRAVPFEPGAVTKVTVPLQDVLHTFEPGHRLMVQVQSTWFPIVDRNPQAWVDNIFEAPDDAFTAAEHRLYFEPKHRSRVRFGVLETSAMP